MPALSAAVSEDVSLFGSIADEGLPRGGTLTGLWKMLNGTGTVTFEDPQAARTHATFSAPGAYDLELSASDSALTSSTRVKVNVVAPGR